MTDHLTISNEENIFSKQTLQKIAYAVLLLEGSALIQWFGLALLRGFHTASLPLHCLVIGFLSLLLLISLACLRLIQQNKKGHGALFWPIFFVLLLGNFLLLSQLLDSLPHTHIAIAALAGSVFIFTALFQHDFNQKQLGILLILIAVVLVFAVVLRLLNLSYFPERELQDEPWVFSFFVNRIETGQLDERIHFQRHLDVAPALYPMSLWAEFIGTNVWILRFYNLILYFCSIALLVRISRNFFGKQAALYTAILALSSYTFLRGTIIRHDMVFVFMLLLSIWLYSENLKRNSNLLHFLSGFILGASWYAHYHAVGFGAVLLIALYAPLLLQARWASFHKYRNALICFGLGSLLAATLVFLTYVLPNWGLFLEIRTTRTPLDANGFLAALVFYGLRGGSSWLGLSILVLACLGILKNARTLDWSLLLALCLSFAAVSLMALNKEADIYVVHLAPFVILVLARFLDKLRGEGSLRRELFALIILCFISLPFFVKSLPLAAITQPQPLIPETMPASRWIEENVALGSVIVAPNWYYFDLWDNYEFYSIRSWLKLPEALRLEYTTNEQMWDAVNADIFIDDPNLQRYNSVANLVESGYLSERGYEVLVEIKSADTLPIHIYGRP